MRSMFIRMGIAVALLAAAFAFSANSAHAASTKQRHSAVRYALKQVGKPYGWGQVGPQRFDCSGLIYASYRHAGVRIPRTTGAMLGGLRIKGKRRPGDMVFPHSGHVAMYIGHGKVVEAPRSGLRIRITSVRRFSYARRSP